MGRWARRVNKYVPGNKLFTGLNFLGPIGVNMKCGTLMHPLAILFCALLCAPGLADTVVPDGLGTVEGNSNNGFPFNIGRFGRREMRYQQIYDATEFGATTLSITGIRFRPDARFGSPFATTLSDIKLNLTTTGRNVDGLSRRFNRNYGTDLTTVFDGDLSWSSADTGSGPRDFDILISFDTPFEYDPNDGNLLLELFNPNRSRTTQFDAAFRRGDAVSRMWAFDTSARFASGRDSLGLVTSFDTQPFDATPNPEPGTLIMLGGAAVAFVAYRRRKQRAAAN